MSSSRFSSLKVIDSVLDPRLTRVVTGITCGLLLLCSSLKLGSLGPDRQLCYVLFASHDKILASQNRASEVKQRHPQMIVPEAVKETNSCWVLQHRNEGSDALNCVQCC